METSKEETRCCHAREPHPQNPNLHRHLATVPSYRTQLVPPGSHRPTTTAPQTNTAPPSGWSRRTPGCYIQRPLTPQGEGLERQGSEQVLGVLKKNERKRFEREAKPPCREGRPSRCFLATLGALLARREAKAEQTFARGFKVQTVAVFNFSDKFLQYH